MEAVFRHNLGETMSYIKDADEFLQKKNNADEKAGYPPNCNEGYVEKDGKCVPTEKEVASFKYKDPQTGEIYEYKFKGIYKKNGRTLIPASEK